MKFQIGRGVKTPQLTLSIAQSAVRVPRHRRPDSEPPGPKRRNRCWPIWCWCPSLLPPKLIDASRPDPKQPA
ncbi:MAG: hypothetical protein ACI9U2_003016 [Bradymonadia bacterium]|jgi:hypothetical protein